MSLPPSGSIAPAQVHSALSAHLLVDGYPFVLDLERSHGSWLVDELTGLSYLDLFTFYASSPLGFNAPDVAGDPEFGKLLAKVGANKPSNADVYTTELAEFVSTFARVLGDPELPHLFFVEGGALAVENALKCAFDWKSRRNEAAGRPASLGTQVLHLKGAFHGRSGYTLSLTNTEPVKTERFPVFDWPRIDTPAIRFPLTDHLAQVEEAERAALAQAEAAFRAHPHDIACFIAEPVLSEGGDKHLRPEFFQAMQRLCHEHDALFVLDEVQTGVGLTGTPWAYQQLGIEPDVVAFGKKAQVGGIMAGRRVDLVRDNIFRIGARVGSTWAGGLVDMVRSRRLLEVIERDRLIERAVTLGDQLVAGFRSLAERFPGLVSNARGRGLMCAFDLPSTEFRDTFVEVLREEGVLVLPGGAFTVRLRPALSVSPEELSLALDAFDRALKRCADGA
ncbi:L-lysine 6-transaminase [Streptomyces sp. MUM 136J]|uniref:L-lysine 6-transaminase n=1 Tax=Streptomyces sp. MUM 136J TaxID=2791992 RepID=UPI001F0336D8|nr:L-lysine 6-transaminase [Streptomyces sp. MUM 136J]MCH0570785.1 L-lysine 6-transaminase [Streptomyces sp. MUM 136J]